MPTETFDNASDFLAALKGTKRKAAKDARPGMPRAPAGEGDRIAQIIRIAAYGYSPRHDVGVGDYFWNVRTGGRTTVCATYAQACAMAEKELSR